MRQVAASCSPASSMPASAASSLPLCSGCHAGVAWSSSSAAVVIGTAGAAPSWPADAPHPRVLVEGASSAWPGALAAQRDGMSVLICPGPERGRVHPCPLLHQGHCPLVDEADAVIVALPRVARSTEPLLDAHAAGDPDQPLALSRPLHQFYGDIPGRTMFTIDPDASADDAVAAIRGALDEADSDRSDDQATPRDER
jgi:hypothetical protein